MGGNRNGELNTHKNIIITMLIGGLWHGASWLFVLWGLLHGVAQCVHKLYLKTKISMPKFFAIFITFMFVNLSWVVFRAENMAQASKIYGSLFNFSSFVIPKTKHIDFIFHGISNNTYPYILLICHWLY